MFAGRIEPGPVWALAHRLSARAEELALHASRRPGVALLAVLTLNAALAALFVPAGLLVAGDQAWFFRELNLGTWLSFVELLFIAAVARTAHRLGESRPWHKTFFGLAAAAFVVLAADEITQSMIFVGTALEALGLHPAAGFHDMEAVLLVLLFTAVALVLLPRALVLLRHPKALVLLGLAVLLGAFSEGLDAVSAPTRWEFVAEETLKMLAEAAFLGGFLYALRDVVRRRTSSTDASTITPPVSQPATTSTG